MEKRRPLSLRSRFEISDQSAIVAELTKFDVDCGFPSRRITIIDPDEPNIYQVYEDIDDLDHKSRRLANIILYPEFIMAHNRGDYKGAVLITHSEAIKDIKRMIQLGYVVSKIERC